MSDWWIYNIYKTKCKMTGYKIIKQFTYFMIEEYCKVDCIQNIRARACLYVYMYKHTHTHTVHYIKIIKTIWNISILITILYYYYGDVISLITSIFKISNTDFVKCFVFFCSSCVYLLFSLFHFLVLFLASLVYSQATKLWNYEIWRYRVRKYVRNW